MDDPKIRRAIICECLDRDVVLTYFDDDALTILVREVAEVHPETSVYEKTTAEAVELLRSVLENTFKCKCRVE